MKTLEIKLPFRLKNAVLALGAQTKNTICFARGDKAYISPIHADLTSPKDLSAFEEDAGYFLKKRPKIIACDLHPEYQSTKFALSLRAADCGLRTIQHHHAHICACMGENGLKNQKVLGIAFDGTGWGADGHIWGGEALLCDYKKFWRLAHLKEIPLVGGERAILEPWRALAAWLNFDLGIDKKQILKKIYKSGINSPLASSMGRFFDAAGSLILGKKEAMFEAELAIELEKLAFRLKPSLRASKAEAASEAKQEAILKMRLLRPFAAVGGTPPFGGGGARNDTPIVIDPSGLLRQIIRDLKVKIPRQNIALRFHQAVAEMTAGIALILSKEQGVNKIVLSGGVFQNKILLKLCLGLLSRKNLQVFTHRYLPCNDASISLGQAVIAGRGG